MPEASPIREGQLLLGPLFSEPMQVETVRDAGPGAWVLGLVGTRSQKFRRVTQRGCAATKPSRDRQKAVHQ